MKESGKKGKAAPVGTAVAKKKVVAKAAPKKPAKKKAAGGAKAKAPAKKAAHPITASAPSPMPSPPMAERGDGSQAPTPVQAEAEVPTAVPAPQPSAGPSTVPSVTGDAPLHELSRDALSAFLYTALLPEEALGLVKKLGLSLPGFRPDRLSEVERCDLLADELRAHPPSRAPVLEALRAGLEEPAFAGSTLDPAAADELLEVAGADHGLAIALWRVVADPRADVRARGAAALEKLAADLYGPAPGAAKQGAREGEPARPDPALASEPTPDQFSDSRLLQQVTEKLIRTEKHAEEQRVRAEAAREKLQGQLKEARAAEARLAGEAARAREAAESALAAQKRAEAALSAARSSDLAAEAQRLRASLRDAEVRLHAVESDLGRATARAAALEEELSQARAQAAEGTQPAPAQPAEAGEGDVEEAPAAWLLPVFTPEFYDSMQGWERRIQRAALKQAFLLSQDHRHPSLRALPLEGLPGYYRVRVATDVRLIYRRGERQDTVEICSLIDREDLDRYVRQAKTR